MGKGGSGSGEVPKGAASSSPTPHQRGHSSSPWLVLIFCIHGALCQAMAEP